MLLSSSLPLARWIEIQQQQYLYHPWWVGAPAVNPMYTLHFLPCWYSRNELIFSALGGYVLDCLLIFQLWMFPGSYLCLLKIFILHINPHWSIHIPLSQIMSLMSSNIFSCRILTKQQSYFPLPMCLFVFWPQNTFFPTYHVSPKIRQVFPQK